MWLPKEQSEVTIEWPYEPEDPGHSCGRIGIRRGQGGSDTWLINIDGSGIDGKPILLPIEGELADKPAPLPESEVRRLQRAINRLDLRVQYLERIVLVTPAAVGAAMDDQILQCIQDHEPGNPFLAPILCPPNFFKR